MNGTNNDEPFFQESKKIKRERFKWFTLTIATNLLTAALLLPSSYQEKEDFTPPWPAHWVEITLEAEIVASGKLPLPVTLLNSHGKVIFPKAFLIAQNNEVSTFHTQKSARFMLAPEELSKLQNYQSFKAFPHSVHLKQTPMAQRTNYEIHF